MKCMSFHINEKLHKIKYGVDREITAAKPFLMEGMYIWHENIHANILNEGLLWDIDLKLAVYYILDDIYSSVHLLANPLHFTTK